MTVKVQVPTKTFLGNGTASPLNFDKRFLDNADLVVTHIAASGTRTVLIEASDYSVSGAGEQNGGQITPLAPISVGDKWEVARNTPLMQPTDYADGDDFPAESHELALDRQMMIIQEQAAETADVVSRALLMPKGISGDVAPDDRADQLIGFGADKLFKYFTYSSLADIMAPFLSPLLSFIKKGDTGPVANTYFDLPTFQAQAVSNGSATLNLNGVRTDYARSFDNESTNPLAIESTSTPGVWWAPQSASGIIFEPEGVGAVKAEAGKKLSERISILDFCSTAQRNDILSSTGALDVSDAWQAALDSLSDNQQLDLVGGVHKLDSPVTMTGKNRIRIIGNGAQVLEGTPGTAALVSFTTCPRIWVHDIHFVGLEDYAYYVANTPSNRHYFLYVTGNEGHRVENVTGEAKRGHIRMLNCSSSTVEKAHFVGFLPDVSLGVVPNSNFCTNVEFAGGANNKALYNYARNHGSCVLWGFEGEAPLTVGCDGHDLHDNGVYLSSGSRGRSFGNDFRAVGGTVVKQRGTQNIAFGNTGEDALVGVSMTGDGVTPDAYGANGYGNITALNSFDNISGSGVLASLQDGLYQRDGLIALNSISNLTSTGGDGVIRSTMTQGGTIAFNSLEGIACDYGILTAGVAGSVNQKAQVVFGNSIQNHTGAQQGIRVMYTQESLIGGNVGASVTNLVQARFVTNSAFLANINPLGTTALGSTSGNSNSDNVVLGHRGGAAIDGNTHPSLINFPSANLPSIAIAPKATGLLASAAGVGYMSVGTASAADWKQIT